MSFIHSYTYNPATQKVVPKDALVIDLHEACPSGDPEIRRNDLIDTLRGSNFMVARGVADQIEAQTKPPRIPEPGWGEQVIASTQTDAARRKFVRPGNVWCDENGRQYVWNTLVDPVLIRDGIEDQS